MLLTFRLPSVAYLFLWTASFYNHTIDTPLLNRLRRSYLCIFLAKIVYWRRLANICSKCFQPHLYRNTLWLCWKLCYVPVYQEFSKNTPSSVGECAFTVTSLYRACSLTTAVRELARYKLDLLGVQDVRWDKRGTLRAGDYICFYGKAKENHQLGTRFFLHHGIITAVNSDRLPYIVLRDRWCNIIVLNVHSSSKEKSDDSKDSLMRN